MRDPFAILGVRPDATSEEIRKAWRRCAARAHPDRNPGDPLAPARFKRLRRAYDEALRIRSGRPAPRRRAVHTPAAPAAPPPVWTCPTCREPYGVRAPCPRCEDRPAAPTAASIDAFLASLRRREARAEAAAALGPYLHLFAALAFATLGLTHVAFGLRPLGAMLVVFSLSLVAVDAHARWQARRFAAS